MAGGNATGDKKRSPSQRGIALIITLIMLSVTLIMALAFLAISRRERASVTTTTDAANSRLATDAALAGAEAQVVANLTAGGVNSAGSPTANAFNFGLLVSTNYTEGGGFLTQTANPALYSNAVNVSYYYPNGTPVSANLNDYLQLLANLYYSPRLPVYIPQNNSNDFRFYLDLNRNGQFEGSGWVPVVTLDSATGKPITNTINGNTEYTYAIGDPQWIGLLEHPDQPYGPNNKGIARYAFVAVPVGSGLDLNSIHNQIQNEPLNLGNDGFFRNQGVGTWEINLAAFLADLNTNQWDPPTAVGAYDYNEANNPLLPAPHNSIAAPNGGFAFADAFSLLGYRYAATYNSLASVSNLFDLKSPNYANFFAAGGVDGYSDLNLQTTFDTNYIGQFVTLPWAGADNTNHFYDLPSDLFNPFETTFGGGACQRCGRR